MLVPYYSVRRNVSSGCKRNIKFCTRKKLHVPGSDNYSIINGIQNKYNGRKSGKPR